jgi:hypothetical protein
MKTLLKIVIGLVVLALCAPFVWAAYASHRAHKIMKAEQEKLAADWTTYESQYKADAARWSNDPLFQAHKGGDAAPLLLAHIRYANDRKTPAPVPEALREQMAGGDGGWFGDPFSLDVKGIDTSWMSGLGEFGFFDIEGPGTPLEHVPFDPVKDDMPSFIDLQSFAKVRLTQGLQSGDARPAAKEVRELARLCFTTEILVGEMIGVALLGIERHARDEAVKLNQDVSGWTAVSQEDQQSLKRLLWAGPAPYSLLATGPLTSAPPSVGSCTGLREVMGTAHIMRKFAESEVPERYAAITQALEKNSCRLRRARAAWTSNDPSGQIPDTAEALCMSEVGGTVSSCPVPDAFVRLSFVRAAIGDTLLALANPDWFRVYKQKE